MATLFQGQKLMRQKGGKLIDANASELNGKVVALYFSAHWCPPCRMFTPLLKDFYEELIGEGFEVVFVSSDRSEDDLHKYLKEAHGDWCFLPYGSNFITTLSEKYKIQGIPTLLVVDPTGTVVDQNARAAVHGGSTGPKEALADWKTKCKI